MGLSRCIELPWIRVVNGDFRDRGAVYGTVFIFTVLCIPRFALMIMRMLIMTRESRQKRKVFETFRVEGFKIVHFVFVLTLTSLHLLQPECYRLFGSIHCILLLSEYLLASVRFSISRLALVMICCRFPGLNLFHSRPQWDA